MSQTSVIEALEGDRVIVIGDTHGHKREAKRANAAAEIYGAAAIVQLGDFAFRYTQEPSTKWFLNTCSTAPCPWIFVRGNHDDTDWLRKSARKSGWDGEDSADRSGIWQIHPNVYWVTDGSYFNLLGRRCLGVGGAYSIDWNRRVAGYTGWHDETISQRLVYADWEPAEIMFTHDAPRGIRFIEDIFSWICNKDDKPSMANRRVLWEIFKQVEPKLLMHGHFHVHYSEKFCGTRVIGLANNAAWAEYKPTDRNRRDGFDLGVLNMSDLSFEVIDYDTRMKLREIRGEGEFAGVQNVEVERPPLDDNF